jgi:hypothetical protein
MSTKIYVKRGNLSYKERRYVEALKGYLAENPNITIAPAQNYKELEGLWSKYCIEDVDFSEVKNNDNNESMDTNDDNIENDEVNLETDKNLNTNEQQSSIDDDDDWDDTGNNSDPFNRDEPIVRDYVKNGSDFPDDKINLNNVKSSYEEPRTQKAQMRMPGEEDELPPKKEFNTTTNNTNKSSNLSDGNSKSINPKYSELSPAEQKKQSKRMAKSIVRIGCAIGSKVLEFWGTNGIKEEDINEYEKEGLELDLQVASIFEPNQVVSVREFFAQNREMIINISQFSEEEKEELVDAITDYFVAEKIGPTPRQNLLLTIGELVGLKVISVWGIKKGVNAVVSELRERNQILKEIRNNQREQEQEYQSTESELNLVKTE